MAERVSISHVLKYTGVFGGVQVLKALAGLIRNKLTAILLGTAGMGLNAVFQNIGELIFSATNMGIPFSSTRNLSESYEQQDGKATTALVQAIRTWALWTALVAALSASSVPGVSTGISFRTKATVICWKSCC